MTFPRLAAIFVAFSLIAAACGDDSSGDAGTPRESGVPSSQNVLGLEYETFDGATARLDDHVGTPLVINFFAEWCPNCISEMPDFQKVFEDLDGEVAFVGLSIDQASEAAVGLVEATGVTYPTGWDPSEDIYRHFRALAMPTTVFVDADGEIQRVWSGVLSEQALRERIAEEIL